VSKLTREQYRNWRQPTLQTFTSIQQELECVCWDFDIPICHLFAGLPAYSVAGSLRDFLLERNLDQEADLIDNDPHAIFRRGKRLQNHGEVYRELEELLTAMECEAATLSTPTPHVHDVIHSLHAKGIPQAIVTNNSPKAVQIYLEKEKLSNYFDRHIFGRKGPYPELLKPNPLILIQAIDRLGVSPTKTLMIGDSVTDYLAAKSANTRFLGFTRTPSKCAMLLEAGAEAVVNTYQAWLPLLRTR
jgi:HAD superfamily hydrolase (TIGR01549 family)